MQANRLKPTQPHQQLPRERLARFGSSNLSDIELLTLILGSGTKQKSALKVAKELLKKAGLNNLKTLTFDQLKTFKGVGQAQAAKIMAVVEIGRRLQPNSLTLPRITTSTDAIREANHIRNKQREYVIALYLNARQELLKKETVAVGSLNAANLEIRDVFAPALKLPCAFLIMIHNHPSGKTEPSQEDLEVTERLVMGGELLGLQILDHLIVTRSDYFSFREERVL